MSPAKWRWVLVAVAAAQLISAAVFLFSVRRQVFDERNYELDVGRYEREGITVASVRAHESPAGPGMTVLASLGGRIVPGSVVARRVPMFAAWLIAVALLLALARQRPDDAVVPIAGALLLVFPHTPLSMATLLTEGPAIACVLAALLTSGVVRSGAEPGGSEQGAVLAGLCVGLSLFFRQYYLALAPAFALAWWRHPARWQRWVLFSIGPLAALAGYFYLWGGLTSVAARAGVTFGYKAHLGVDFLRPFSALGYVGIYVLPLLPREEWRLLFRGRRAALAVAVVLGAALITCSGRSVWGNGPLMTILSGFGRIHPAARTAADWILTSGAFLAVLLLAALVWTSRPRAFEPLAVLCWSFVVFFALEQAGVGGTIPYYERYAHQTVFFAAALVAILAPPRTSVVLTFILVLFLESEWILWRNVLGG
jgi:hypothetical protein